MKERKSLSFSLYTTGFEITIPSLCLPHDGWNLVIDVMADSAMEGESPKIDQPRLQNGACICSWAIVTLGL